MTAPTAAEPMLGGGGPTDYFSINAEGRFRMTRPR